MKKSILVLVLLIFTSHTYSQKKDTDQLGAWYIFATNTKVSEKFSIQAQTQLRFFELARDVQQFKIRVGGTYQISKGFSGSFGYAFFKNDPSYLSNIPADFSEHRIYENITLKSELSIFKLTHRYMAEHRFLVLEAGNDNRNWLRYMLKIDYPINEKWTLDVFDEIFLNLEHPNFGQNWLGSGLSYQAYKNWKIRVGYFNQHFENASFNRLVFSVFFNIDATQPKN